MAKKGGSYIHQSSHFLYIKSVYKHKTNSNDFNGIEIIDKCDFIT